MKPPWAFSSLRSVPVGVSYSGGASSEWLVEAIWQGIIPAPERYAVFFADTGAEHQWTYKAAREVEARCIARGVRFIRCAREVSLFDHIVRSVYERKTRMDHPPFWVEKLGRGKGKLSQRCTEKWKSRIIRKAESAWLKEIGARKEIVSWIGYGADELSRAVKASARSEVKWERRDFPAIRYGRTRDEQRVELLVWTGRVPKFSMCTFCPFKTPARWRETQGVDLIQALRVDVAIRDLSFMGIDEGDCFLSDRLVPVENAGVDDGAEDSESHCGTGHCFV